MEYASPGISVWNKIILTVVVVIVSMQEGTRVGANRHRQRHNRYSSDVYHGVHPFYDDYEDSTVMLQPEFLNTRTNITVIEGSMATLPCSVRYLGTKQVAWRLLGAKDDHFLTVGAFTWVREDNIHVDFKTEEGQITHWNLVIKSVELTDEGTYQCQITDKIPIRTHVHLTVKKRPEREPAVTMTGKEFVDRNERIKLRCNATGGPRIPVEIDWFKDGTKIDPSNRKFKGVLITKYRSLEYHAMISELTIEKTDEDDTGTYICRSSDRKIASQKVTVLVADTTNVKRGTASKQDASSDVQKTRGSHSHDSVGSELDNGGMRWNVNSFLYLVILSLISYIVSQTLFS